MKKLILTPLLILLIALLVISAIVTINYLFLDNKGGNSLGGLIALLFAFGFLGVIIIEQSVIKYLKLKTKPIWIGESIAIILIIILWGIKGFEFSIG